MAIRDYLDAVRGAAPPASGTGKVRTARGELLDRELYKMDTCPYCQRVFQAISRLEIPLRLRDIVKDPEAATKLVEVGGKDQVPCLFVDGKPMYESADIVLFLEERVGPGSLPA